VCGESDSEYSWSDLPTSTSNKESKQTSATDLDKDRSSTEPFTSKTREFNVVTEETLKERMEAHKINQGNPLS
jgi:hypothetical protein